MPAASPTADLVAATVRPPRRGASATAPSGRSATRAASGSPGCSRDLVASGEAVLAVAAHAPHRARGAAATASGGFAVCSWAALEDDPGLAAGFAHVVALDPPAHAHRRALSTICLATGWTHLAWGDA